jgi:REP element-mobilizing transposase RayT
MPRKARLDFPGALHHIMVRGNNKSEIFKDDRDRSRFLERLGENVLKTRSSVYAWVLMNNHVHILFKSGEKGISAVMRKLLTWYAIYYNRRHERTGHLFENRYKSILCEEDRYLLALIRYIHLNPIRAGVMETMKDLDAYRWSGHSSVIGKESRLWMDTEYVLLQFGDKAGLAKKEYRRFINEGVLTKPERELEGEGPAPSCDGWSFYK